MLEDMDTVHTVEVTHDDATIKAQANAEREGTHAGRSQGRGAMISAMFTPEV